MKILMVSDFHISETKRLEDLVAVLDYIVELADSIQPTYLILLGDVFDKRKPTPREMKVFNEWLMKITRHVTTEVMILEGNHDQDNGISGLTYLEDLHVNKVRVITPPHVFYKFYLGHEQIDGAMADNGIYLSGGSSLEQIIAHHPECEVFAFGHFHKPQILKQKPLAFYAGSINKVSFGERDDVKQAWLFEDTKNVGSFPLPTRKMLQYEIPVCEDEKLTDSVNVGRPWNGDDLKGALVKVVFSGSKKALQQVNEENLKAQIVDTLGAKSLHVSYSVTDKIKPRNSKITESIKQDSALREYFNTKSLEPTKVDALVSEGLNVIKEVDEP